MPVCCRGTVAVVAVVFRVDSDGVLLSVMSSSSEFFSQATLVKKHGIVHTLKLMTRFPDRGDLHFWSVLLLYNIFFEENDDEEEDDEEDCKDQSVIREYQVIQKKMNSVLIMRTPLKYQLNSLMIFF